MATYAEQLGKRLSEVRAHMKLNQKDFGKLLGYEQGRYSHYENGARHFPIQDLEKLFEMSGVSTEWLLFGRGPMFIPDDIKHIIEGLNDLDEAELKNWVEFYNSAKRLRG